MAPATGPPPEGGPHVAFLRDRRLMLLLTAGGVIMLVALTVIEFSGALFTSTSRSPANQFAAGEVAFTLSKTGPVVPGSDMLPGDVRSGDQVVTNTGHRARLFLEVLQLQEQARPPLMDVLNVEVRQTNPAQPAAYDGPLAGLGRVRLGTLAHDEQRTYTITVTWPASDNFLSLRGNQITLDWDWQMESVS